LLWRAVYNDFQMRDGQLKPGFFRDKRGLSCDLARFSTREKSRLGRGLWPTTAGLVEISAGLVRGVTQIKTHSDVLHDPVTEPKKNYAHSVVLPGNLNGKETDELVAKANIIIQPTTIVRVLQIQ
jgi:hypothetical protein